MSRKKRKKTAIKEKINDGGMNFFHSLTLAFSLFRSYTHSLTHSHLVYLYRSIETLLHTLSLSHSFSHSHNLAIFQTHAHSHSSNYLSLPPSLSPSLSLSLSLHLTLNNRKRSLLIIVTILFSTIFKTNILFNQHFFEARFN